MYTSNKSEVWVSHHTSPHWAVEASQSNVGAWLNFHHLRCVVSLLEYALRLGITSGHCVVMRHNNEVNLKAKQRQLVISLRGLSVHTCTHEKVHFPQCVALENELIKLSQTAKLYCSTTGVASKCMNSGHIENNNKRQANASCTFGEVKSIDIIWHSVWCSMHAAFVVDLLQNLKEVCHFVFRCGKSFSALNEVFPMNYGVLHPFTSAQSHSLTINMQFVSYKLLLEQPLCQKSCRS